MSKVVVVVVNVVFLLKALMTKSDIICLRKNDNMFFLNKKN